MFAMITNIVTTIDTTHIVIPRIEAHLPAHRLRGYVADGQGEHK